MHLHHSKGVQVVDLILGNSINFSLSENSTLQVYSSTPMQYTTVFASIHTTIFR